MDSPSAKTEDSATVITFPVVDDESPNRKADHRPEYVSEKQTRASIHNRNGSKTSKEPSTTGKDHRDDQGGNVPIHTSHSDKNGRVNQNDIHYKTPSKNKPVDKARLTQDQLLGSGEPKEANLKEGSVANNEQRHSPCTASRSRHKMSVESSCVNERPNEKQMQPRDKSQDSQMHSRNNSSPSFQSTVSGDNTDEDHQKGGQNENSSFSGSATTDCALVSNDCKQGEEDSKVKTVVETSMQARGQSRASKRFEEEKDESENKKKSRVSESGNRSSDESTPAVQSACSTAGNHTSKDPLKVDQKLVAGEEPSHPQNSLPSSAGDLNDQSDHNSLFSTTPTRNSVAAALRPSSTITRSQEQGRSTSAPQVAERSDDGDAEDTDPLLGNNGNENVPERNHASSVDSGNRLSFLRLLKSLQQRCCNKLDIGTEPAILIFVTVSCVIATVAVSSRLMEKSCFNDVTASDVEIVESVCYLVTTLLLVTHFCVMCFGTFLSRLKLRETVKRYRTRFDVAVTVAGMILFSIFPLVLNSSKIVFMMSCRNEVFDSKNSTATGKDYSVEQWTSAMASICVIFISVFVIIHKLLHFSVGCFCWKITLLGVVGLTVFILWITSLTTEVAEHSPLQLYKQCKNVKVNKDCRQKEDDLANFSSLFTPLVIEYCIMCLTELAELGRELASAIDSPSGGGGDSPPSEVGDRQPSDDVPSSAGESSENQEADAFRARRETQYMVIWLTLFAVMALAMTIAYVSALNSINEDAGLLSEEPTTPAPSEFSQLDFQPYRKSLKRNVSTTKLRCQDGVLTTSSPFHIATPTTEFLTVMKDLHRKIENYFIVRTVCNGLCFVIFFIIYWELKAVKKVKNSHSSGVSDFIIVTTCCTVTGFDSLCIAADFYCLLDNSQCRCLSKDYFAVEMADNFVNILQFVFQANILLSLEHCQLEGYARGKRGTGRCWRGLTGLLFYLFVVNAVCWGTDSFYEVKTDLNPGLFLTEIGMFGKRKWHVLTQIFYPPAVYFRFHSALIFLKAFYHTWLKGDSSASSEREIES